MYLVGYFILLIGALAALWYGGVLRHVSPVWVVIGLVIAVGLGIMLSVSGGKPEITREEAPRPWHVMWLHLITCVSFFTAPPPHSCCSPLSRSRRRASKGRVAPSASPR